jgi:hypothetical protein
VLCLLLCLGCSSTTGAHNCGCTTGIRTNTARTLSALAACIKQEEKAEYEAQNLLGCTAMFLIECRLMFQRYVLPPSSPSWWRQHIPHTSETLVNTQLRTRQNIPEDSELHTRCRENLKSQILSSFLTGPLH